ncbi:MAG: hypothetical protein HYY18_12430 [Planctomycetes bacterium]|nr:hypothetical protein [Planctomycetota bacterium]
MPRFRRFVTAIAVLGAVVGLIAIVAVWRRDRMARAIRELKREHPGRIAWWRDTNLYVLDMEDLGEARRARRVPLGEEPVAIRWSGDGRTVYAVFEGGTIMDDVHRVEAVDTQSGLRRIVLNLGTQGLEDNDMKPEDLRVESYGDAEAEQERLYFHLGTGEWYSIESKRPRIRPEQGPPAGARDQKRCPDGKHRLDVESGDEDSSLWIKGPGPNICVTENDVEDEGAWWFEPK